MLPIGQRYATLLGPGPSSVGRGDLLYDERGLPKWSSIVVESRGGLIEKTDQGLYEACSPQVGW